jgi:ATP synthase protein I
MSQPPDQPGRRRVKRAAAADASDAYQGAFEAVLAVLVGAGIGYWVDSRWDTTPYGVLTGVVVGFAAMVLRLLRLGRELVPETDPKAAPKANADSEDDRGPAESPALSDVWRDDATDERQQNERE